MKKVSGFVYLWKDMQKNKFYLGSHIGAQDDGYTGSGHRFLLAYNKRPESFRRRILEQYDSITRKELLAREQLWLQQIKPEELGKKYYNEKRVAAGGNIVSELSEEKRKLHKEKSLAPRLAGHAKWCKENPEKISAIAKKARASVKNPSPFPIMYGDDNPAKRPDVRQKLSFAAKERAKRNKENNIALATKTYKIIFPNGNIEFINGQDTIKEKYCSEFPLKFSRFIDTGEPITSNRHKSKLNPLIGAIIEKVK